MSEGVCSIHRTSLGILDGKHICRKCETIRAVMRCVERVETLENIIEVECLSSLIDLKRSLLESANILKRTLLDSIGMLVRNIDGYYMGV